MQPIPKAPDAPPTLTATALALCEHWTLGGDRNTDPDVHTWLEPEKRGSLAFCAVQFVAGSPWLIRGRLQSRTDGPGLRLSQVVVEPWRHESEVSGSVFRRIKLAKLRHTVVADLRWLGTEPSISMLGGEIQLFPEAESEERRRLLAAGATRRRPGRPGHPDSLYEAVAHAYLRLYRAGVTRHIHDRLSQEFNVPKTTVIQWVYEARRRGFLTTGRPGVVGAQPGPRLIE
jgi:hypothetical protein